VAPTSLPHSDVIRDFANWAVSTMVSAARLSSQPGNELPGTPVALLGKRRNLRMKTTYGILAGMIGFGAWLWIRRRMSEQMTAERGTVIYRNTPEPTPLSAEGVI